MSEQFIEQAIETAQTKGILPALELIDKTVAEADIQDVTEQVVAKSLEEGLASDDAKRNLVIKRLGQDSEPFSNSEIDIIISDEGYDRAIKRALVLTRVALKYHRKNSKRY